MEILDIKKELAGNAYPGRGIVIGKSADGVHAVIAYFIMGRSVNSRNRVFVEQGIILRGIVKSFNNSSSQSKV